ncbi:hypothetical protein ACJX0J_018847, partial [Zea mays]
HTLTAMIQMASYDIIFVLITFSDRYHLDRSMAIGVCGLIYGLERFTISERTWSLLSFLTLALLYVFTFEQLTSKNYIFRIMIIMMIKERERVLAGHRRRARST